MKSFRVIALVQFATGVIGLTPEQAKPRMHLLKPVEGKKDVYEILKPVQFKVGEIINLDGQPDKHMSRLLERTMDKKGE